MPRLTALLLALALAMPARAAPPEAAPFLPSAIYPITGPATARGALVWLQGGIAPGQFLPPEFPEGQPAPLWLARVSEAGWDVWRYNRIAGHDALAAGAEGLVRGLQALHAAGYRHVVVAGFSRGAFIALSALAHPDLVEAIAVLSPAAHGVNPARRAQAMADFQARLDAARGPMRFAIGQFSDDPFDPDPPARARAARDMAARTGITLMQIYRPDAPTGHMACFEPEFDPQFGAKLVAFLLDGGVTGQRTLPLKRGGSP
jgi:pimeloyl-ACP methyl ester carboxylesterase